MYIQETSQLLKIQESVLLSELNKIVIGDRRKKAEDQSREERKRSESTQLVEEVSHSKTDINTIVRLQEKESMRLLLNYAESHYDDQRLVGFYVDRIGGC